MAIFNSLPTVVLLGLPFVGIVLYVFGLAVYRIHFHPLAKYPGPLLAKFTDLHSTYHAWKGDRHLEFWRCHEKYGPIVRFGPNSVSFNSNTALKEIYGFKANVRKAKFYEAFWASKDAASTHSSIDKSIHARKRRVLSQAFSDSAMKSMENHILAHIRQFCANLTGSSQSQTIPNHEQKGYGAPINVSDQANYLTFDIMGDLCFGKAFGMLESPENRFAIDMIGSAAHRHLICGTYLPIHEWHLDKWLFRKIAVGRARYMQYSKAQAAERTKMGLDVDRKDFFYHLLKARDPETGAGFTTPELWGESNLLIIAGSDTTSTALASALFYLVHNPSALHRVCEEVRSAFSGIEEIRSGPTLAGLPFLRACIDEAMRMAPPVGGVLPREVQVGGMEIDGELLPAGTVIGVPHYSIHHNPKYFPNPFQFRPERWIAGSLANVTKDSMAVAQSAFCPFSIGPRGCIGKGETLQLPLSPSIHTGKANNRTGMAYIELTASLARTLYSFDMRLAPGYPLAEGKPPQFNTRDTFTSIKDGPMVQFRPRTDS